MCVGDTVVKSMGQAPVLALLLARFATLGELLELSLFPTIK